MGDKKLSILNTDALEWDSLRIPEELSTEELASHEENVAEYLAKRTIDHSLDLSAIDQVVELTIDDRLLESEELVLDKITNDELFNYFQDETIEPDPNILFPKIERINILFWFLHNLGQQNIREAKILVKNRDELSIIFYCLIEAAVFFGFLKRGEENGTVYLVPTDVYEEFMGKTTEMQYPIFLKRLGRNETISEVLKIQLNDPIYDSISRQMVHNTLVTDPNIEAEGLSNDEVTQIVNGLRYWYLGIKQVVLEN
jgi:hypothetical protein